MTQRIRWILVGAALALAVTSCAGTASSADTTAHQVTYDVTITGSTPTTDDGLGLMPYSDAAADMTFEGEAGTVQQLDQAIPWTYARTAAAGDFLYLSAQNKGDGEITCTISVDGQQVKSSASSGEFAICQIDAAL